MDSDEIAEVSETEKWKCDECDDKEYATEKQLKEHKQKFHAEKKFPCTVTGCKDGLFTSANGLRRRVATQHEERSAKCNQCRLTYGNDRNLKQHQEVHQKRPFMCSHCEYCFETKQLQDIHEPCIGHHWKQDEQTNPEKPCKCTFTDKCVEHFKTEKQVQDHIREAHKVKPGRKFATMKVYQDHLAREAQKTATKATIATSNSSRPKISQAEEPKQAKPNTLAKAKSLFKNFTSKASGKSVASSTAGGPPDVASRKFVQIQLPRTQKEHKVQIQSPSSAQQSQMLQQRYSNIYNLGAVSPAVSGAVSDDLSDENYNDGILQQTTEDIVLSPSTEEKRAAAQPDQTTRLKNELTRFFNDMPMSNIHAMFEHVNGLANTYLETPARAVSPAQELTTPLQQPAVAQVRDDQHKAPSCIIPARYVLEDQGCEPFVENPRQQFALLRPLRRGRSSRLPITPGLKLSPLGQQIEQPAQPSYTTRDVSIGPPAQRPIVKRGTVTSVGSFYKSLKQLLKGLRKDK